MFGHFTTLCMKGLSKLIKFNLLEFNFWWSLAYLAKSCLVLIVINCYCMNYCNFVVWRALIRSLNLVIPTFILLLKSLPSSILNKTELSVQYGWKTFAILYNSLMLPPSWSPLVLICASLFLIKLCFTNKTFWNNTTIFLSSSTIFLSSLCI